MLELIWSVLNILIVLFFFYLLVGILFRGKKIFEGKFKNLSIIILILGAVQIISATIKDESENSLEIENRYKPNQPTVVEKMVIKDDFLKKYNLSIIYSKEDGVLIPIKSNCTMTGLVSGFDWEFVSIHVEKKQYYATGILIWDLFGIEFYRQEKNFQGELSRLTTMVDNQ